MEERPTGGRAKKAEEAGSLDEKSEAHDELVLPFRTKPAHLRQRRRTHGQLRKQDLAAKHGKRVPAVFRDKAAAAAADIAQFGRDLDGIILIRFAIGESSGQHTEGSGIAGRATMVNFASVVHGPQ